MSDTPTPLSELVPLDLDISTADRLRLVADIISLRPDLWNQGNYVANNETEDYGEILGEDGDPEIVAWPKDLAGRADAIRCGTTACIAGWAAVCSTQRVVDSAAEPGDWNSVGAAALGLDDELAATVFSTIVGAGLWMIDMLRGLADLPEPRTMADARSLGYYVPRGHGA